MKQSKATLSRSVTKKQLEIIVLLYQFRFGTAEQIGHALGLADGRYSYTRLETLVQRGLIGKHYDKSYKLLGKPARYYLRSSAKPLLREHLKSFKLIVSPQTLKNASKDVHASETFIARKLTVFTIANQLRNLYGSAIFLRTKDAINLDSVPRPLPDAYISLKLPHKRPPERPFLLLYLDTETPFFAHAKLLRQHYEALETPVWDRAVGTPIRGLLLVCESPRLFKQLRKTLASLVYPGSTPEIAYTTLAALTHATEEDDSIWQTLTEPLIPSSLTDL